MVASTGAVSADDASKGVAAIYGRHGDSVRAKRAVDIALRGAMGGLNFAEVAQELTRHGGAIDDGDQADRFLGRMAKRQTGGRGSPEEVWRGRMENINADAFLMEARNQGAKRSGIPGLERDAFMGAGLGSKDAAMAADPKAFFEGESFKKLTQAIDDLNKLSASQGTAAAAIADMFSPNGSFKTQVDRLIQANAKARGIESAPDTGINPNQVFPTGPYAPREFGR
jgi:hypothetical protein